MLWTLKILGTLLELLENKSATLIKAKLEYIKWGFFLLLTQIGSPYNRLNFCKMTSTLATQPVKIHCQKWKSFIQLEGLKVLAQEIRPSASMPLTITPSIARYFRPTDSKIRFKYISKKGSSLNWTRGRPGRCIPTQTTSSQVCPNTANTLM